MKHMLSIVAGGFAVGCIILAVYEIGTSNGKLDLLEQQQRADQETQERLLAYELKASAREFSGSELSQIREALQREVVRLREKRVGAARER